MSRALTIALMGTLLLAFALRVYDLETQSAWHDETYCVLVAQQPLAQVVAAQAEDIHPPLYFVLLHFWLPLAGRTDFAVRFLSVAGGVLLVALLYRVGASCYSRPVGLLAAELGAIAPFGVAYSQEIRNYALVTLLALASSYLGYCLLDSKSQTPNPKSQVWLWGGYVLVSAAALYAHYFAALVLVAQNVFFVLWVLSQVAGRRSQVPGPRSQVAGLTSHVSRSTQHAARFAFYVYPPWLAAQLAVVGLYAPQLLTATRQLGAYTNPGLRLVPPAEFLRGVWQAFNVGLAVDGDWLAPVLALLALVFVAGLARLAFRPSKAQLLSTCYLATLLWVPGVVFLLITLTRPLFHPRFLLVALPAYTLLLAAGLAALWRLWRPVGILAATLVLLASAWGLHGYYHDERFYKADTRAVAGFLRESATANDLVLVDVEFVLGYYDHGPAPYQYILANDDVTPAELSALCQGQRHLYRVHWQEGVGDPKNLVDYLLRKYGQPLGEWGFRGYQVFGYVIPPDPAFAIGENYAPRADVFDGRLQLAGVDYGRAAAPAHPGWAALRWRTLAPMSADYKCFVHLRDAAGRQVAGADTLLMNNQRQTTAQMPPGGVFLDYHLLDLPPDVAPGVYTLYTGVYDPAAAARLSVLDARGAPAGTEVIIGAIQVEK